MPKTRFDYVELRATKTDEGFLIDSPIVARTGILTYLNKDGTTRKELRRPEQVFKPESLASFIGKPITVDHPKGKVSSRDVSQYSVGTILSAGRQDGDFLRTDIVIHQPEKIGERRELSVGYDVDLDETPGEWNGERYDAEQLNIVANHLSIVKRGRAGATARLNLDSDEEPETLELPNMPKIRLDNGIEYEAPAEVVAEFAKVRNDVAAAIETGKAKDATIAALTGERDTLKARVDSLPAELEKARADAAAAVAARTELEKVAATFKVDCAGKTDDEVRKAVIKSVNKDFDDTGKSAEYIAAAFDIAKATRSDAQMQEQRKAVNQTQSQTKTDAADEGDARTAYIKKLQNKQFA